MDQKRRKPKEKNPLYVPKYKWPEPIEPQLRTREQRREYLALPSVQRWLARYAEGLRVLDVRFFHCTKPDVVELTEIYYQRERKGVKEIKVKIVCSDPPPYFRRLVNGTIERVTAKARTKSTNSR